MPRTQAGVASANTTTSRRIGSALGVAVTGAALPATDYAATTFDHASRPAWWITTGCGVTVAAPAALTRYHAHRSTPPGTAPTRPRATESP
ncbi:hypothetical protein [Streptomyces gibsoniae]|uniref:Uncharacterized protein n=1 Tax=Streptomyces gibsoniae TaxID=3075529 RepID=A0ABU2U1Z5_9ACTN|nr:hypothetical protein [Streptomyces sp. DSM 41699]MDT0467243.1 hypothetical protein [Streptomyces sp. DSM 41699]